MCLQAATRDVWQRKAIAGASSTSLLTAGASSSEGGDAARDITITSESQDVTYGYIGEEGEVSSIADTTLSAGDEQDHDRRLAAFLKRYMRFSSGTYGRRATEFLYKKRKQPIPGFPRSSSEEKRDHDEHTAFSEHISESEASIYHSSFSEKGNASILEKDLSGVSSLYHPYFFLIVDHSFKQVVLSLRGTLSLHDLMVDLTCETDIFEYDGAKHPVHSGMFRAARQLASPDNPIGVLHALRDALQKHNDYGLVLTGHSLGAGLASLLALHFADPRTCSTTEESGLPAGRRVRCFAYSAPCTMGLELSRLCRELITSVVLGDDLVSRLSLGSVRDLKSVALRMHEEKEFAKEVRGKVLFPKRQQQQKGSAEEAEDLGKGKATVVSTVSTVSVGSSTDALGDDEETIQFVSVREKITIECFKNEKLYPGGRVFWILPYQGLVAGAEITSEDAAAFGGPDASGTASSSSSTSSTTYRVFEVNDLEVAFGEIQFTKTMLADHMPNTVEEVINSL
ncbi:hypothetical protein HK102_008861 [Quaeritorhiza haematococci]|nr:hypothetical protein HK102_008861 [Quaeritorhiza haematococci]